MDWFATSIGGAFIGSPFLAEDERGKFVKFYSSQSFFASGLPTNWNEDFYSSSRRGVIRGMHFQIPPHDHEKLVYCMHGKVLDVLLDLRKESQTFGQYYATELDDVSCRCLFIPKGVAHGFLVLSEYVLMGYKLSAAYSAEHDKGIHWGSFGFEWGVVDPILSPRDGALPTLADYASPFTS